MKSLQLSNLSLGYIDNEGTGPSILLVHGNSSSKETFKKQLANKSYRIVAIDLPGHGDSGKYEDASFYNIPAYASIVAEAAKALDMEDAVVVGWSLGGHVVLEAVEQLPKAKGFVIYGTPPLAFPPAMEEAYYPHPAMAVGFAAELTDDQIAAYADAFFSEGIKAPAEPFLSDIKRSDGNTRAGLAASIVPDGYTDEIKIVENLTTPLAILHGVNEQLVNIEYIKSLKMSSLWKSNVQMIDDAGHATHWENSEQFNNVLFSFVDDVN